MRSLLFAVLAFVGACAANPVKSAMQATPENRAETVAYALFRSFLVVDGQAKHLIQQPSTPRELKQALIALHEVASPSAMKLQQAAETYNDVRETLDSGGSTEEDIANALLALNAAINDFAPKSDALAREVVPNQ